MVAKLKIEDLPLDLLISSPHSSTGMFFTTSYKMYHKSTHFSLCTLQPTHPSPYPKWTLLDFTGTCCSFQYNLLRVSLVQQVVLSLIQCNLHTAAAKVSLFFFFTFYHKKNSNIYKSRHSSK